MSKTPTSMERDFNPRVAAPDFAKIVQARFGPNQAVIATYSAGEAAYGPSAKEGIDFYKPSPDMPYRQDVVGVYLHGGYWRAGDRKDSAYAALPFLQAGMACAIVGYELCPAVSLESLVAKVRYAMRTLPEQSTRVLGARPTGFVVCGTSAGAHLAACVLSDPFWQERCPMAILLSGIYDLRPVLAISVNDEIGLDASAARRLSPMLTGEQLHARQVKLIVGGAEPQAWRRQSYDYTQQLTREGTAATYDEIADANHFSLSNGMTDPSSQLGHLLQHHISQV